MDTKNNLFGKLNFFKKNTTDDTINNANETTNQTNEVNILKEKKAKVIEVLNFWKTLEFITQVDRYIVSKMFIENKEKTKIESFTKFGKEDFAFDKNAKENLLQKPKYQVLGEEIQYVIGETNRNDLVEFFQQFVPNPEILPELSYPVNSSIAWFSFKTLLDGTYVKNSLSISPLLWIGSVWCKSKELNSTFDIDVEEFNQILYEYEINLEGKSDETEKIVDFLPKLYSSITKRYVDCLNLPKSKNEELGFYNINIYKDAKTKDNDKMPNDYCDLGRSFFANDISLLIENVKLSNFAKSSKYEQEILEYVLAPYNKNAEILNTNRTLISTVKGENNNIRNFFTDILNVHQAPLGKWPSKFMPVLMQQVAVNIAISKNDETPIFSVNGPPGTGKTTLLKEIVANNIVQRAILLAEEEVPDNAFNTHHFQSGPVEHKNYAYSEFAPNYYSFKNDSINDYGMLVTSSNNSAVENITIDLPKGSDILGGLEYSEDENENIAKGLDEVINMFNYEKAEDVETFTVKEKNEETGMMETVTKTYNDIFFTRYANKLLNVTDSWGLVSVPLGKQANIKKYCDDALIPFLFEYKGDDSLNKHKVKYTKSRNLFLEQLEIVKTLQAELDLISKSDIDKINAYSKNENKMNLIDDEFMDKYFSNDQKISTDAQVANPWFTAKYNREREKLFFYACKLHKEFILSSKKMRHNIENMLIAWNKHPKCKERMKQGDRDLAIPILMQSLFVLTPVISTTFASAQTFFRDVKCGRTFGTLIVDESGQAVPQMVVGSMFRCRQAIIVGDPKQIEPVVTAEGDLIKQLMRNTLVLPYKDKKLSVQSLADYINPYGTFLGLDEEREWVGCPLTVHRRCIDPMYSVSNELSYNGTMKQQTGAPKDKVVKTFILEKSCWIDVQGNEIGNKNHFVSAQGEVVIALLEEKFKKIADTDSLPQLYIITPFTSVKEGVIQMLKKSNLFKQEPKLEKWLEFNNIGTVHTFQGKGTDEVIFLLGCDMKSIGAANFVNKNIVNVAATRAKFRFYMIGDQNVWTCDPVTIGREITKEIITFEQLKQMLNTQQVLVNTSTANTNKINKTDKIDKIDNTNKTEDDLGKCPLCNAQLRKVKGKFGEFISCPNYQECGYKHPKAPKTQPAKEDDLGKCPLCDAQLRKVNGKFSEFISCPNYQECGYKHPKAQNTQPAKEDDLGKCPLCDAQLRKVKGKFSEFISCPNYQECGYKHPKAPKTQPAKEDDLGKCPLCNAQLRKVNGKFGEFISCPNYQECGYKHNKK